MLEEKLQPLTIFILVVALIILIIGIEGKLKQRKNQFICQAYLRHWYTAWQMYHKKEHFSANLEQEAMALLSHLYKKQTYHCPSAPNITYSYIINQDILQKQAFVLFSNQASQTIMILDGDSSHTLLFHANDLYKKASYRHLGKANLLFLDGSIRCLRPPFHQSSR